MGDAELVCFCASVLAVIIGRVRVRGTAVTVLVVVLLVVAPVVRRLAPALGLAVGFHVMTASVTVLGVVPVAQMLCRSRALGDAGLGGDRTSRRGRRGHGRNLEEIGQAPR